jgi:hypothetical protein
MANEFKGAYFQMKQEIMEAYLFLRKNNMTVPSETLEFMKDAAIEKLDGALENAETKSIGLHLQRVSGCFSDGFVEVKGYCDDGCEAVEWVKDECKHLDKCKLGCGTVWAKPK